MPARAAFGLAEDEPFVLKDADVTAFGIIFSEFEGAVFDTNTMRFKDQK